MVLQQSACWLVLLMQPNYHAVTAVFEDAGHRKAVSYVRYLNGRELVSASTDSTLRLWDTKACTASRVFNGHNNEKNFVGLSVDNDFIACGSETNEVGWCNVLLGHCLLCNRTVTNNAAKSSRL